MADNNKNKYIYTILTILGIFFIILGILFYQGVISNNYTPEETDRNQKLGMGSISLGVLSFIIIVIILIASSYKMNNKSVTIKY